MAVDGSGVRMRSTPLAEGRAGTSDQPADRQTLPARLRQQHAAAVAALRRTDRPEPAPEDAPGRTLRVSPDGHRPRPDTGEAEVPGTTPPDGGSSTLESYGCWGAANLSPEPGLDPADARWLRLHPLLLLLRLSSGSNHVPSRQQQEVLHHRVPGR